MDGGWAYHDCFWVHTRKIEVSAATKLAVELSF